MSHPHLPSTTQTTTVSHFVAVQELTFWEKLSEDERRASINPNRSRIFGEKTGWGAAGLVSTKWNTVIYPAVKRIIESPENYEQIFGRSKIHMSRPCSLYMVGNTVSDFPGEEPWQRARPTIVSISTNRSVARGLSNLLESIESLQRLHHGFSFMFFEDQKLKLRMENQWMPADSSHNSNLEIPETAVVHHRKHSSYQHDLPHRPHPQQQQHEHNPVALHPPQQPDSYCGIPVHFVSNHLDTNNKGTIAGVISINNVHFGLCAAHSIYSDGIFYDDTDSDTTSAITSDDDVDESRFESLLAKLREGAVISVFQDELSGLNKFPRSAEFMIGDLCGHIEPGRDPIDLEILAQGTICPEMDWALIKLKESHIHHLLNSFVPVPGRTMLLTEVSHRPPQGEVFVAYRGQTKYPLLSKSDGVLDGIILPGTHHMVDVWTVETTCSPGTSGSFVVNPSTGSIYGMIVATSLDAEESYMIPVKDIMNSIRSKWPEGTQIEFPGTLTSMHNLALTYWNQGRLTEAEEMYIRALRGYENNYAWGPDHTSTLATVGNLGNLYAEQGKLIEAEKMLLRALRGKEKAWGSNHALTLDIVGNLGNVYAEQGKLIEAEKMLLRALQGKEKALGPDHTLTLDTVGNLGNFYADLGKTAEAEEMLLRALQGYENAWGPDHTSTLATVNNLGNLYIDQGRIVEAEETLLRALRGYEKAWGPDHVLTLDTVDNLGSLYVNQGKIAEAEEMYFRALQGKEKVWGPDHISTLNTVNNLANLYADQGMVEIAEAEEMYVRALRGYEKVVGADHWKARAIAQNLRNLHGFRTHGPVSTVTIKPSARLNSVPSSDMCGVIVKSNTTAGSFDFCISKLR